MILNIEEIDHIANLAKLKLSQDEKELYRKQLSAILDYIAILQGADTTGISSTSSVLPSQSVLRDDDVKSGLTTEQLLSNTPYVKDQQFKVPPVLE
jgi:aspartyl-tRNA(Asn)/glutamyl-tRNA(Gln) amidotransferase subunit C